METQLTKFSEVDSAIAKLSAEFLPLKIAGVDDAVGFKRVHSARMEVKAKRVEVEKARKEYKENALAWGRKVDSEAKRITALLAPIEGHLESEENAYTAAKEAIKNAARLKAEAEEKARREAEEARLKAEREAENARLAEERAKIDAERKAMEERARLIAIEQQKIADQLDAERFELEKVQRAQEAEQKRLADIEAARLRAIEMEKAREEAAEKARVETEARMAREADEKAAREKAAKEAAEAARIKAEATKSSREQILSIARRVDAIDVPSAENRTEIEQNAFDQVVLAIDECVATIHEIAAKLSGLEDLL